MHVFWFYLLIRNLPQCHQLPQHHSKRPLQKHKEFPNSGYHIFDGLIDIGKYHKIKVVYCMFHLPIEFFIRKKFIIMMYLIVFIMCASPYPLTSNPRKFFMMKKLMAIPPLFCIHPCVYISHPSFSSPFSTHSLQPSSPSSLPPSSSPLL